MSDYKKFFHDLGRFDPHLWELGPKEGMYEATNFWEDLYQAFKARLMNEGFHATITSENSGEEYEPGWDDPRGSDKYSRPE